MKQKTSITLSAETLHALDVYGGPGANRSRLIETAVVEFLDRRHRDLRDTRDRAILERESDALNREIEDVLDFQVEI